MSTDNINPNAVPERANRPGLSQIKYRIGTHSTFLGRMIARAPGQKVDTDSQPLQALTTRDRDDASLAFLDAWATALDVLSFYQERIANEGFIRTADERRSVQELARSIGYELKPGVASGVFLAFQVDEGENAPEAVNVTRGTQALSIPGQDQLPQTFETSSDFLAKGEWNAFHARLRENQSIAADTTELYLDGVGTGLQSGDLILIVGDEREEAATSEAYSIRVLNRIVANTDEGHTLVGWDEKLDAANVPARPRVFAFRQRASLFGANAPEWLSLTQEERDEVAPTSLSTKAIAVLPGTSNFVSGGGDGKLYLWDSAVEPSLNEEVAFNGAHGGEIKSVAAFAVTVPGPGPDPVPYVASGSVDGTIRIWTPAGEPAGPVTLDDSGSPFTTVWSLAFNADGTHLAAAFDDGSVLVFDTASWNSTRVGEGTGAVLAHTGAAYSVTWVEANNTEYLVTGGADGDVRVWAIGIYGTAAYSYSSQPNIIVTDVAATAVGNGTLDATIVIADTKRHLVLWHFLDTSANALLTFDVPDAPANGLAFPLVAENGDNSSTWPKRLLVGVEGGSLQEWYIMSQSGSVWPEIRIFDGHDESINSVAYVDAGGAEKTISGGDDEIQRSELVDYTTERVYNVPLPPDYPEEWPNFANTDSRVDLDSLYPRLVSSGWVLVENANTSRPYRIAGTQGINRADFLLNEKLTRLHLDTDAGLSGFGLRDSTVYVESEALALAAEPIPRVDVVSGDTIDLDRIVTGLETGRPLILTGLRSRLQVRDDVEDLTGGLPRIISTDGARTADLAPGDILTVLKSFEETADEDQVWSLESETGFVGTVTVLKANVDTTFETIAADPDSTPVSEVAFLKNTLQSQKFSTLQFEEALQFSYDRTTVAVQANVVEATHGEVVQEILGSGDGSVVFQNFALKDPPLTYVSAPTETGTETTLEVRVNDVLWEESSTLFGLGERDRKYAVRHEDDGSVRVMFGDGKSGERLPTGPENVTAVYRKGIGPDGEIAANQLRIVQNAPVGISQVDNPLPASGSSAPEPASVARERAPFSVLTLGRIVSLKDFQDFARGFGGIGKARATSLWQEEVQLVYITIAGEGGAPVLANSELYLNLGRALDRVRDPFQPVRIASFDPLFFNVAAKLLINAAYIPERVFAAAETVVREFFAFENRDFGQEVTVAELIQILEAVEGVDAVDFDQLSLTTDALFNMSIADFQSKLENTSTIDSEFRDAFNLLLAAEDPTRAPLSEDTLVFEEKKGLRWVLREPAAEDGYAVIKEAGSLNVYDYPARVTPFLDAAFARRDESGVFQPAQMLLLNSDAAGVILMEFTN
ncbi:MAG: hypothetical protein NXI24_17125 [bacterium]|nr:hypothetical protein [bacterium]